MLTEEKIKQAAEQYCRENNGGGFEYQAFLQGAEFMAADFVPVCLEATDAIHCMQAENERLRAALTRICEMQGAFNNLAPEMKSVAKDALEK